MAFPVSPQKEEELAARMAKLGVREADLDETFVRGSGPGGQHVNKTATCVMLVHRPSGTSVRCQASRSQGLNRFYARRLLLDKIERRQLGQASAAQQEAEKIRRQKRRRSRRAKAKMLEDKRQHAEKKATRGRVRPNHD
ncbi:MAG: peptide chain release factor family protein [Nitrospirota bacterium]